MAEKLQADVITQSLMQELIKAKPDERKVREQARSLGLPENLPLEGLMAQVLELATKNIHRKDKEAQP